jgi:hypothetical protein
MNVGKKPMTGSDINTTAFFMMITINRDNGVGAIFLATGSFRALLIDIIK